MFSFTVIPFFTGMTISVNNDMDLTIATTILVALSSITAFFWIFIFLSYFIIKDKVLLHQLNLIHLNRIKSSNFAPLVSIIIPARNEEKVIARTVINCLKQNYTNIEIIVVCHNSTDRTFKEAKVGDNRVRVHNLITKEAGKGIALNYGIDKSSGKYILVLDSDGKLNSDFISNTLPFFNSNYAAVQGRIISSNRKYNLLANLLSLEGDLFSVPFMTVRSWLDKRTPLGGTGFMIDRNVLMKIGKFSNSLIDDFELSFRLYRAKYRIAFAPMSVVLDEKPPVFEIMIKQRSRWVKGHIDLLTHRLAEPKDVIGVIYWLNPVFTMASMSALVIATFAIFYYIFNGSYPYAFAHLPFALWFALLAGMNIMYLFILKSQPDIYSHRNVISAFLLTVFTNYWYVALVRSLFIKSWSNTKTEHGFDQSLEVKQENLVKDFPHLIEPYAASHALRNIHRSKSDTEMI